jgi:hypothetical protein
VTTWSAALTDGAVDMELRYGCGSSGVGELAVRLRQQLRRFSSKIRLAPTLLLLRLDAVGDAELPRVEAGVVDVVGRCSLLAPAAVRSSSPVSANGGGEVVRRQQRLRRSPLLLLPFSSSSLVLCGAGGSVATRWRRVDGERKGSVLWLYGHVAMAALLALCVLAMEGSRGQGNAEWRRLWRDGEESVGWGFL